MCLRLNTFHGKQMHSRSAFLELIHVHGHGKQYTFRKHIGCSSAHISPELCIPCFKALKEPYT